MARNSRTHAESVVSIVHPVSSSTLEAGLLSSVMVNYKASRTSVELRYLYVVANACNIRSSAWQGNQLRPPLSL